MRGYLLSRMPVEKAQSQKYTTGKLHRIKSDQLLHNRGTGREEFSFPSPAGGRGNVVAGSIPPQLEGPSRRTCSAAGLSRSGAAGPGGGPNRTRPPQHVVNEVL
jgi:hypothetical protein